MKKKAEELERYQRAQVRLQEKIKELSDEQDELTAEASGEPQSEEEEDDQVLLFSEKGMKKMNDLEKQIKRLTDQNKLLQNRIDRLSSIPADEPSQPETPPPESPPKKPVRKRKSLSELLGLRSKKDEKESTVKRDQGKTE